MYKKQFPDIHFKFIPPLIPFSEIGHRKSILRDKWGIADSARVFLFAGSLKTMKNPNTIVEASVLLGREFLERNHIHFLFAGNGHLKDDLMREVTAHGLNDYFQFTGILNRDEMATCYHLADAYIIASDYEGTSLSLLEAMFNGLLILGSNVNGINEMLTDKSNSLLFQVRNPRSLADQIAYSIGYWEELGRLREQAKMDFNERYSYSKMMKDYNSLFFNAN